MTLHFCSYSKREHSVGAVIDTVSASNQTGTGTVQHSHEVAQGHVGTVAGMQTISHRKRLSVMCCCAFVAQIKC